MKTTLKLNAPEFCEVHVRNLFRSNWVALSDEGGAALPGIRGCPGVAGPAGEGVEIGADLIEMQPGSAFPLHVHAGQHVLYVIGGQGLIHVDGVDHPIQTGDAVFIAAEYPHSVKTEDTARGLLLLLSVGYPHRPIGASDRMRLVYLSDDGASADAKPHSLPQVA